MSSQHDLEQLARGMRAMAPRREPPPAPAHLAAVVELRSRQVSARRRWTAVAVTASLVALSAGYLSRGWLEEKRATVVTIVETPPARVVTLANHSQRATVLDLGAGVGKVLARPGARAAFDADGSTLELDAGTIVAHIQAGGRGFRVITDTSIVEVKGTLFEVSADNDEVRVWEGRVETRRRGGEPRVLEGSGSYDGLTAEDLSRLDVVLAPAPEPPRTPSEVPSERQLLLRAHAALNSGEPGTARRLLRTHRRRYPKGVMAEEAALLLLQVLVALDEPDALASEAEAFLRRFPASSRTSEVERLLGRKKRTGE